MAISADKKKNLTAVLNGINKKFGASTVSFVKDKNLKIEYLQSPSHEFNAMLNGGIGVGRITEFYGENSSGKTSMAIEIIAHNQKINPDFVAGWFETEGSIDEAVLQSFGVDMDRLVYWDQTELGAEQGLDILRGLISSGQFNMLVVNSTAGLAPKKEIEDDIEKQNVALTARIMSKLMRVITGACHKTKTTLVLINQVRTNVGVMYGNPEVTPGGKAVAFYATQRISFRRVKIKAGEPIAEDDGLKVACRVIKNRLARKNPFTTCEYYAEYGKGINTICELPGMLEREGILRRAGAYYYWEDENGQPLNVGGQECKFKSKAFLVECLTNNTELREKLSEALNERIMGGVVKQTSLSEEEIGQIKQLESTLELEETFEELDFEEAV